MDFEAKHVVQQCIYFFRKLDDTVNLNFLRIQNYVILKWVKSYFSWTEICSNYLQFMLRFRFQYQDLISSFTFLW